MRKGAGVANTLARLFLLHSWGPLQPRGLVSLIMVELLLACGVAASLGSLPVEVSRRARLRPGSIGVNREVLHRRPLSPGGVVGVGGPPESTSIQTV